MRISTAQMFTQNSNSILNKQSAVNLATQKISSGKRVETSGEDPVAALGIDNLNGKNALIDQFVKNIDYATNHLAIAESKLGSAETLVASMKDQILRSMNGSLQSGDRQVIADELRESLQELVSIANSRDESGNYIFAGFKTDQQPFAFDNSGNMIYSGDSGERTSGVATGVAIETNIPGDQIFMNAPNPLGDFGANYLAGQTENFQVKSAEITNSTPRTVVAPESYTFAFTDNGTGGVQLEVFDSGSNSIYTDTNFDPTAAVEVNGMAINISGTPGAGDSFTLEPLTAVSIFDTLNQAISVIEDGQLANTPQGNSELAQILDYLRGGTDQIGIIRGKAGNSLNSLESFKSAHVEEKIVNSTALSMLEDLDYATAITEYEKQRLALNAVSQVFGRVNSTSLFDYI
ncbi:flagellar hook-associated protein FlgL [Shewanella gelidii]|uniref:Flagellar hook-associated protein FlgL n=1 Tax=Shewanella gelidii TaxID=1642821 RepID=A0A917JJG1_9GAMM|nr:flagellar hook-associated protein FlgL [Shewanella gelidii]MCL1096476.1 flagellar hook-associated protein FlgL [Shewanella gelidii]GGI67628.1 flagellar hook-associated protein FlgL [Shewanella gelidii]